MAKSVHDSVLDAALDILKNNTENMTLCSAAPTTYTEALTTNMLATIALTSGDFTNANGDTSGRKTTIAQQTGETVTNTGTATHWALIDNSATTLLYVGEMTSQALTAANALTVNAVDVEIADPV